MSYKTGTCSVRLIWFRSLCCRTSAVFVYIQSESSLIHTLTIMPQYYLLKMAKPSMAKIHVLRTGWRAFYRTSQPTDNAISFICVKCNLSVIPLVYAYLFWISHCNSFISQALICIRSDCVAAEHLTKRQVRTSLLIRKKHVNQFRSTNNISIFIIYKEPSICVDKKISGFWKTPVCLYFTGQCHLIVPL